jgi:CheY-like chemotaxis protein
LVLNGILWILRTGAPWADLPDRYPSHQTCHRRFQRWVRAGVLRSILEVFAQALHDEGYLDVQEAFMPALRVSPKRVLLVEDNADVADMLTAYLQQLGHEVIQAHDGPAGLDAALRHRPEVIVCDIGLPGLDGYEIARRIRESPAPQPCVLIAVSGYGASTDRERARAAGFDHHLTKPADPVQLADLIARTSQGDRRGQ